MGVDLFAGPLQRYYTRRWETPTQVFARDSGLSFTMIHPGGVDPLSLTDQAAITQVRKFRDDLVPKLNLDAELWQESFDTPYKVLQLTREGLGALLLWVAYRHNPTLARPRRLPSDPWEDETITQAYARGYYMSEMVVLESNVIVPGKEARVATQLNPIGQENIVATTAALEGVIESLAPTLDLDSTSAVAHCAMGPSPSHGYVMVKGGADEPGNGDWQEERTPQPLDEVREFARWGLACFMTLHSFATRHQVPMVRDE